MVILLTACLLAVGCVFAGWQAKTRGVEILYNLLFGVAASIIASVLMAICFIAFAAKDERISRFLEKLAVYGVTDFYEQRQQISIEETLRWLKGAHREIDILTVWRQHWAEDPEIETILLQKASIKCVVRIVLVKPDSALGKLFCEKELRHKRPGGILKRGTLLETLSKHKDVFKTTGGGLRVLSDTKDFLSCSIVRVDSEMRVNFYLQHVSGEFTPVMLLTRPKTSVIY